MAVDELILLSFFEIGVEIALIEKGIEYRYQKEEILGDKSPLLLCANPLHKETPVPIHNGKAICESLHIVEYIDHVWQDRLHLLPCLILTSVQMLAIGPISLKKRCSHLVIHDFWFIKQFLFVNNELNS